MMRSHQIDLYTNESFHFYLTMNLNDTIQYNLCNDQTNIILRVRVCLLLLLGDQKLLF